ncbi:hypothetical protein NF27_DP00840 [Candidatus Jidaibacter acanthamoeba]|uniref:Porin domain-containing protein n=1 Tax=Candidatus Jidaibacter acanthamoebae TaxID=86105 RepID=A0A0C1QZU2_9RICK|nr:porin [Candidatus Jidaibacter acanthamoeba]KIE05540.1 hypothetical protein NF27_DP00840 [Candidatus Jidaibacter acanthamoeba]
MNKFITATILGLFPLTALAGDDFGGLKLKLSGSLNTQAGHVQQKKYFRYKTPGKADSGKLNSSSIVNDTKIKIEVDGDYNGLKYGGAIKLYADTSKAKNGSKDIADNVMTYVESGFGRIEAGSHGGATDKMKVSAVSVAKATGGIDGDYKFWIHGNTSQLEANPDPVKPEYESYEDIFVSDPYLAVGTEITSKANKISYYTPSFNGFKAGVSYAPDSEAKGTIENAKKHTRKNDRGLGYTNIVELALQYEQTFDDLEFNTSFLYQHGKAKKYIVNGVEKGRKKLNAWEVGALIRYQNFAVAGSYIDWGKTGATTAKLAGQKYGASLWNVGAAYETDKFGASVTYYESKRGATVSWNSGSGKFSDNLASEYNKLKVLSLGVEYKLAQGLMPYAEATHFKHDRAGTVKDNKGQVYLAGVKVSF